MKVWQMIFRYHKLLIESFALEHSFKEFVQNMILLICARHMQVGISSFSLEDNRTDIYTRIASFNAQAVSANSSDANQMNVDNWISDNIAKNSISGAGRSAAGS